jgi:predicted short-subunit dehydrogenase-like oxidoreductase (DUF2520 family)
MPALPRKNPRISLTVIGLGPVGQAVACALSRSGKFDLILIGRDRAGEKRLAKALKSQYLSNIKQLAQDSGIVIICIKDNQIKSFIRQYVRLKPNWSRFTVLHTSGVLGSDVLKPLASKGASVAAWHPYQTFPRRGWQPDFAGVTFGISGDARAMRVAGRLTRMLGGKPLRIRDEDRVLYHLSAVLACGFVAADLEMAVRVLKKIGLSEKRALEAIMPIATQTLKNATALGPARALTGPAVRKDEATIRKHLQALRKNDPDLAQVYTAVSRYLKIGISNRNR